MKVLLYDDDLFYYAVVMHTDMQELMWAAECIDSVLSAIIRDVRLDLIQPVVSSAHSCMCTVCTVETIPCNQLQV